MLAVQRIGRIWRTLGSEGKPVTYQRQRVLDVCPFLKLTGFLLHHISSLPGGYARTANIPLSGPSPNGDWMLLLPEDVKHLVRLV